MKFIDALQGMTDETWHPPTGAGVEIKEHGDTSCEKMWHPARGAWIEIAGWNGAASAGESRTPQGVRGLKYHTSITKVAAISRTPQGVRGLKWHDRSNSSAMGASHPARGAWIEIRRFRVKS